MIESIEHYPIALRYHANKTVRLGKMGRIYSVPKGRNFSSIDDVLILKKPDLLPKLGLWANAIIGPCVLIAMVIRETAEPGHPEKTPDLREIRLGHFSTTFIKEDIDAFLQREETPVVNTSVWVAGLAQKTSHDSLRSTVEKLAERLSLFGLPLALQWESSERPLLLDIRNSLPISDLGFGILTEKGGEKMFGRFVSFGATRSHALMASTLHPILQDRKPLRTSVFTVEKGMVTIKYG